MRAASHLAAPARLSRAGGELPAPARLLGRLRELRALVRLRGWPRRGRAEPGSGLSLGKRVFTELAFSPGDQGEAFEASADGSVVVGYSRGPNGKEAFRWEAGVMTPLGDLPGGPFNSEADAVSADGTLIAGAGTTSSVLFSSFEAALFGAGGPTRLSDIAGGGPYFAIGGMSADGSVMAGTLSPVGTGLFLYQNGTVQSIGDLPGGSSSGSVTAVSADGTTVIGWSGSNLGSEAFRYSDGAWMGLGMLGGGYSVAYDTNADGSVIVGQSEIPFPAVGLAPFLWDAAHGMRNLQDILVDEYGVDLEGLELEIATGISDNGRTIVGWGINEDGDTEGWIAVVPEPAPPLLLLVGLGGLAAWRRSGRASRSEA